MKPPHSLAPQPSRAILAVIFIALSAIVGGIGMWRTRSRDLHASQAEQGPSPIRRPSTQAIKKTLKRALIP